MYAQAEKLVQNVTDIYSLPTIYYKLDEKIQDPNSSLEDIAGVIIEDTGLSARLLKLVNSAFYNFPSKIDTITRAVSIIGTKQLRDLVLATSVVKLFRDIPEDVITMESFWQHSISCGVTARLLASHKKIDNIESLFVAGLLHDIGSLIIYSQIPEQANNVIYHCRAQKELMHISEKEMLGYDHSIVGGMLLKQWRLPQNLIETTMYHHWPNKARQFVNETAIVHVADIIVDALQLGTNGEQFVCPMNEKAWAHLDLDESVLPSVVSQIELQYRDFASTILSDD
jgi:HD-like signal output (HDOD) protein